MTVLLPPKPTAVDMTYLHDNHGMGIIESKKYLNKMWKRKALEVLLDYSRKPPDHISDVMKIIESLIELMLEEAPAPIMTAIGPIY